MTTKKRWDQYGPYQTDHGAATIVAPVVSTEARPITFFDGGRVLCLPACGISLTMLDNDEFKKGLLALRLDREHGVYREMAGDQCRSMAEALLRLADMLEGKIA
ncbi:hypothetical protein [Sphingobium yanoikuyae]|uniref:hypothetical protein n=1 Tax=Sphingobium yanoikuyae TaxID=13690 RepID=UPI00241E0D21|nr:hypothetical protein [Sphingobium yanoikuyae]